MSLQLVELSLLEPLSKHWASVEGLLLKRLKGLQLEIVLLVSGSKGGLSVCSDDICPERAVCCTITQFVHSPPQSHHFLASGMAIISLISSLFLGSLSNIEAG